MITNELHQLRAQLDEANRMWNASLETQGALEADIAALQIELKESQWLTKRAVEELAALKADSETEIALRALIIQRKNQLIDELVTQQLDRRCPHSCESCKEFERHEKEQS